MLFLRKPLSTGNLLPARKIFIERSVNWYLWLQRIYLRWSWAWSFPWSWWSCRFFWWFTLWTSSRWLWLLILFIFSIFQPVSNFMLEGEHSLVNIFKLFLLICSSGFKILQYSSWFSIISLKILSYWVNSSLTVMKFLLL